MQALWTSYLRDQLPFILLMFKLISFVPTNLPPCNNEPLFLPLSRSNTDRTLCLKKFSGSYRHKAWPHVQRKWVHKGNASKMIYATVHRIVRGSGTSPVVSAPSTESSQWHRRHAILFNPSRERIKPTAWKQELSEALSTSSHRARDSSSRVISVFSSCIDFQVSTCPLLFHHPPRAAELTAGLTPFIYRNMTSPFLSSRFRGVPAYGSKDNDSFSDDDMCRPRAAPHYRHNSAPVKLVNVRSENSLLQCG